MNLKLNERLKEDFFLNHEGSYKTFLSIFNGCLIYFTEVGLIREYNPTEYFFVGFIGLDGRVKKA